MKLSLKKYNEIYLIHLLFFLFIGFFGILCAPLDEILLDLKEILLNGSILLTDYMYVGGIGATLINSSITSIFILLLYKINKIKPSGSMIMSLWLIVGFSMIGKNFINIWPTILGVYLYSKIQNEPFSNYILIATLSTALAPLSNEIFKVLNFNTYFTFLISTLLSILLGIFLPPLSKFTLKIHQGYNLYNVGFANGLITILLISILKYFGIEFKTNFLWSTQYKNQLIVLLTILFTILILLGANKENLRKFYKILKHSGRTMTDYYLIYKNAAFLNMGILGMLCLGYILIIDGDLNGAVIALLLCVVAFGSLGKHILNITPIIIGVIIGVSFKKTALNTPIILLTTLGSTTLAPIAGQFGFIAGIISGFIHLTLMLNIGHLSGGINLYNNGFIGGIVAITLLPIIDGMKKGD